MRGPPSAVVASLLLLQPGLATAAAPHRNCKAPAPPPAPPPQPPHTPHGHDPEYYSNHVPLAPGVTLHANIHPLLHSVELLLQANAPPGAKDIAWLGLGLSPDGRMSAGSFMVGWGGPHAEPRGCVKATSLPVGAAESAPNGPAGFPIEDTGWAFYDGAAWLQVSRPWHDNLPGHTSITATGSLHVMYAAGSKAPTSCSGNLEAADYHDILHGAKAIQVGDLVHGAPSLYSRTAASAATPVEEDLAALPQRPQWPRENVAHLGTSVHADIGYTTVTERIFSQPFYLRNGDLVFTAFDDTILPMPSGDYAVLKLEGGLMDCNNESVPLDVVYNHHWLMKPVSGPTTHFNKPCPDGQDFSYVFGVGAESRKTPTIIPDGYGYHVQDGTVWGANIHILHTEGLAGGDQGSAHRTR